MTDSPWPSLLVAALLIAAALSSGCECVNQDTYNTHGGPKVSGPSAVKSECEEAGGSADPGYCEALCTAGGSCPEGFSCEADSGFCAHATIEHCMVCAEE